LSWRRVLRRGLPCRCFQGTRYLVSNGTSYAPYYAATPYAAAAPAAGSAASAPAVYPAALAGPPPTAIQYSMPTTVDNGCGQQMLLVGNGAASTGQQRGQGDVRLWDLDSGDAVVHFQVSYTVTTTTNKLVG